MFQSPSLRGSGRFAHIRFEGCALGDVSIPFIAGQWSLRMDDIIIFVIGDGFQSPSLRGSGRFGSP